MDILKYTTETRLYIKNNKDIVNYFDEVKNQYSYILRKVYSEKISNIRMKKGKNAMFMENVSLIIIKIC